MKSRNALHRLAIAIILPLLTVAGCDSYGVPPGDSEESGTPFRIDCNWSDHAATTVFAASGAIQDDGTVTGDPVPALTNGDSWAGVRTFHGKSGDLKVYIEAGQADDEAAIAKGDFVIVEGTDQYVGYLADGDFSLVLDGNGRRAEVFEGMLHNGK